MSNSRFIGTYLVPTWAINYLINFDWSGLTGEDVAEIDEWEYNEFISVGWTALEYNVCYEDGAEFEVPPHVAFGMAADCYQVNVYGREARDDDDLGDS